MNFGFIFFVIHFSVFAVLVIKDIKFGVIKTAALSERTGDTSPASIIFMDFFWEFILMLYILLVIAFTCSIPSSLINKFFHKKYKRGNADEF